MPDRTEITVGELKSRLNTYSDEWTIVFASGALTFNRLKARGDRLVDLEFEEIVYRDHCGKLIAEDTNHE